MGGGHRAHVEQPRLRSAAAAAVTERTYRAARSAPPPRAGRRGRGLRAYKIRRGAGRARSVTPLGSSRQFVTGAAVRRAPSGAAPALRFPQVSPGGPRVPPVAVEGWGGRGNAARSEGTVGVRTRPLREAGVRAIRGSAPPPAHLLGEGRGAGAPGPPGRYVTGAGSLRRGAGGQGRGGPPGSPGLAD